MSSYNLYYSQGTGERKHLPAVFGTTSFSTASLDIWVTLNPHCKAFELRNLCIDSRFSRLFWGVLLPLPSTQASCTALLLKGCQEYSVLEIETAQPNTSFRIRAEMNHSFPQKERNKNFRQVSDRAPLASFSALRTPALNMPRSHRTLYLGHSISHSLFLS